MPPSSGATASLVVVHLALATPPRCRRPLISSRRAYPQIFYMQAQPICGLAPYTWIWSPASLLLAIPLWWPPVMC